MLKPCIFYHSLIVHDPVRIFTFEEVCRCDRGRGAFGRAGGGPFFQRLMESHTKRCGKKPEVHDSKVSLFQGIDCERGELNEVDDVEPPIGDRLFARDHVCFCNEG